MKRTRNVQVQFLSDKEKEDFQKRAEDNGRSMSSEFRVSADLPEIKAGGKRKNAGRKKQKPSE